MNCIKEENDALIFVNKELRRMNDELTTELQSRSHRSNENEASDNSKKRFKKPKTSAGVQENNEEAARVCKYDYNLLDYNLLYFNLIFVGFSFNSQR